MKTTSIFGQTINFNVNRLYGRFSSIPQERGDSYRRQVQGGSEFSLKNGLGKIEKEDIYFDEGVSGKAGLNLEKEFGRILNESREGDVITVEFLDRIGRQNPFILGKLLYDTVQKGITVIAWAESKTITKDNINNLDTMFSVFTGTAIGFSDNQRKMKRGNEVNGDSYKLAMKGTPSKNIVKFLPTVYMWNEQTKKIEIKEDKAKIIRRIFDDFCAGYGKTVICQRLNADNVPTVYRKNKAGAWLETSISKILRNPSYAGEATIKGNKITCFKGVISKEQFEKTEMLLERFKTRFGKGSNGIKIRTNNIFPNIAVCSECGGKLAVNVTIPKKEKNQTIYSFKCRTNKSDKNKCSCYNMVNVTNIEKFFFSDIIRGDGSLLMTKEDKELTFKKESLKHQIEKMESAISNLYDLVEQGDTEAKKRIELRKVEKVALEGELRKLNSESAEVSELPNYFGRLSDLDLYGTSRETSQKVIHSFFPHLSKSLANNDIRRELSVIIPSIISKLEVDLRKNEFTVYKKDGTKIKTINVPNFIAQVKAEGIPFK